MLLGLDVGRKIIGVAVTDEAEKVTYPLTALPRAQNKALTKILAILEKEKPRLIVVGLPLDNKRKLTKQAVDIQQFCSRLSKRSTIEIVYVDESYSTEDALERLNLRSAEAHQHAKKKGTLDAAAAAIILQRYLDSRSKK